MATKAKMQMRDERTGLLIGPDTMLIISDEKDAQKAVKAGGKLMEEIAQIRTENDLPALEADYELIRKSLRDYQNDADVESIGAGGFVSALVKRYKTFWVWDENDIPENIELEDAVTPLRKVVRKKYHRLKERAKITGKITRRVIDPTALDEAVKRGDFTLEDVQDSQAEYLEAYYVQIKPAKPK